MSGPQKLQPPFEVPMSHDVRTLGGIFWAAWVNVPATRYEAFVARSPLSSLIISNLDASVWIHWQPSSIFITEFIALVILRALRMLLLPGESSPADRSPALSALLALLGLLKIDENSAGVVWLQLHLEAILPRPIRLRRISSSFVGLVRWLTNWLSRLLW